ncbi:hypothetical protein BN2476_500003 [Paraburkholderia piptadeniae]|uniref:Uncharacterized protein n=1 Tax=Paraburkholderia piptadeniae TaxID=1701573 RepID=A0A1N7SFB7_9BURK|nr:hypothetical protein BN2476_500003 [Paraburkholderia piptadeniae]
MRFLLRDCFIERTTTLGVAYLPLTCSWSNSSDGQSHAVRHGGVNGGCTPELAFDFVLGQRAGAGRYVTAGKLLLRAKASQ